MSGVNKVIILGHVGKDPEVKTTQQGMVIANFSIATSEQWKDKQTSEAKEHTEWHRITLYGRLAEIASQFIRKGSKVYIEGKLATRKWQDKDTGQDRYATDIIGKSLQLLSPKTQGDSEDAPDLQAMDSDIPF